MKFWIVIFCWCRLEGNVAIITGGACGIGVATARPSPSMVRMWSSPTSEMISVKPSATRLAFFVHCNVTKEFDVANVVDVAVSKYGKLDIMFNNAGISGSSIRGYPPWVMRI